MNILGIVAMVYLAINVVGSLVEVLLYKINAKEVFDEHGLQGHYRTVAAVIGFVLCLMCWAPIKLATSKNK